MTFVIVGGGPTGAELAGALGEIANDTLAPRFPANRPLAGPHNSGGRPDRVLPSYPAQLSAAAQKMLERLEVTVRTGAFVTNVREHSVTIQRRYPQRERFPRAPYCGPPGVLGSPLGRMIGRTKRVLRSDKAGRIIVEPDLTVPGHPEIFVIGDLANYSHQTGKPLPGVAQPAIQQGRYVAKRIGSACEAKTICGPFTISTKEIWRRSAAALP